MTTRTPAPEARRRPHPERTPSDYCRTCGMTFVHWAGCPEGDNEPGHVCTDSGGVVRFRG